MRKVAVFFNKILAGRLAEETPQSYVFKYDKEYLVNPDNPSIAYEFPRAQTTFRSDRLFPFFANLLPEGKNKNALCGLRKIDENDIFGLLVATAGADTVGAVSVREDAQ